MVILESPHHEICDSDKQSIIMLIRNTWPPKEGPVITMEDDMIKFFGSEPDERHIFLKSENKIIGYAKTFTRDIQIGHKNILNCALACVCVDGKFRKNGYGKLIVQKALSAVDSNQYECSLFQTAVPEFYEKVGAKRIYNKCIVSKDNSANPWWDPYVIIYPQKFLLKEEVIVLLGKGY